MCLHLVRYPQHALDYHSAGFHDPPQRSVACQQNTILDVFRRRQCKTVVQFYPGVLIEVTGCPL